MADTKRLALLKNLTAHLETEVSVANGYHHDIAGRVYRGRTTFSESDPVPCLSILEALNPDRDALEAGRDKVLQRERWTLLIQGWAPEDRVNPTDPAHILMGDVKRALAKLSALDGMGDPAHANHLFGGLAVGLSIEPGTVRPPDEVSALAYFWVRIVVEMVESLTDPFDLS